MRDSQNILAYTPLESLLVRFPERELQRLVGGGLERALRDLVNASGKSRQEWLAECAIATHGHGLLRQRTARKGLLSLLSPEELREVAEKLCDRSYRKSEDNAVALARLPWTHGSSIANYVAERFGLPYDALPQQSADIPTIEIVDVLRELPPLHDYQQDLVERVKTAVYRRRDFLLQLPTGAGKTRVLVEAIVQVLADSNEFSDHAVIWLAHAEELCEQAAETFMRVWSRKGPRAIRLVRFFGSHEPAPYTVSGAIVIASLQKVYARLNSGSALADTICARAKVVAVDEAHRSVAPSFRHVIEKLTEHGAVLAGLSATPGRQLYQEEENRALSTMFSNNLITAGGRNVVSELQEKGIIARLRRRLIETGVEVQLSPKILENLRGGFDFGSALLKVLAASSRRNRILLETVEQEVHNDRPTILFACSVDHARLLAAAMRLRGIKAAAVDGSMNRFDRQQSVEEFRAGKVDVITNFGVLTTGFDAPRTRTVIVARPTTSAVLYGQMVGRALRGPQMGGGAEAWVIDMRDNMLRFGDVRTLYAAFDRFWDPAS